MGDASREVLAVARGGIFREDGIKADAQRVGAAIGIDGKQETSRNQCRFCSGSHIAVAAKLAENRPLVEAVVADFRSAPIAENEKALLAYLEKLTLSPASTSAQDVEALRAAGWGDEAIYDAVTVCAMFNFYNRWVEGSGVQDMPQAAYDASGERLATIGYAPSANGAG